MSDNKGTLENTMPNVRSVTHMSRLFSNLANVYCKDTCNEN